MRGSREAGGPRGPSKANDKAGTAASQISTAASVREGRGAAGAGKGLGKVAETKRREGWRRWAGLAGLAGPRRGAPTKAEVGRAPCSGARWAAYLPGTPWRCARTHFYATESMLHAPRLDARPPSLCLSSICITN